MSKSSKRAAIEAVARRFSATWEKSDEDWPDAVLTIGGRRIAVEVAALRQKIAEGTKPHLRFDKVVLRLVGNLQAALSACVPDGEAVVVTVTAPIGLPAKTASALEIKIRDCLARRPARMDIEDTICGNRVRARLVKGIPKRAAKVIGFVHNPDCDPDILLDLTQSLLRHIGAAAHRHVPMKITGERWLVLVVGDGFSHIETCRQIYSQLSNSTDFNKVLMVFADGRVEGLSA